MMRTRLLVSAVVLPILASASLDDTDCGYDSEGGRIVGGEITQLDEFPWVTALEYKSKFDGENAGIRCGGSLISNKHVLTAAHCLVHVEFQLIRAWLGDWNISSDPDCHQEVSECADRVLKLRVVHQLPHVLYRKRTSKNDIGLILLESAVQYSPYISPICLPPPNRAPPPLGTKLTAAGWGVTENGTASEVKRKVGVPLVQNALCNTEDRIVNINQLCAGGMRGKDSCQGDSGGPLMNAQERPRKQWFLEGIVSYGTGCGVAGTPAVYTRVSRYITWIKNNVK